MTQTVGPTATALDYVRTLIAEGDLKPGDRLPTERELAAGAGVSRAIVRTALDDLEARGVVLRHVGRGTFLTPDNAQLDMLSTTSPSPAEIMAARLALEPQLMPLAVASATRDDLAEMDRCLRGGDGSTTSDEFERWDTALHHSFAVATHNVVLTNVSQLLIAARQQPVWGGLKRRSFTTHRRDDYCTEHRRIVAAIHDRDPDSALEAMRAHLRHVRLSLLGD